MRRLCLALLLLPTACKPKPPSAPGYFNDLCSLRRVLNESEVIVLGTVESVDAAGARIRVDTVPRGACAAARFKLKVPANTGFLKGESERVLRDLVPGCPVVAFSCGSAQLLYINRYFVMAYGDWGSAEWSYACLEAGMNRTYNGAAGELSGLLPGILEGRFKCPPPDPKLPPIDIDSLQALPSPGQPVDVEYLPAPFRPGRPPPPELRRPENPPEVVAGLRVEHFKAAWGENLDVLPPLASPAGVLRLRGFLETPVDGDYCFYLESKGPTTLSFGGELLLSGAGGADLALRAGRHAITVTAVDPALRLLWSGPGFTKRPVPAESLWRAYQ